MSASTLYRKSAWIRRIEERLISIYPTGRIRCPMHLSIGQEAVAVGVCAALGKDDAIVCAHRCHAPYLAKGGSLKRMLEELTGKRPGGSQHLTDRENGVWATSAVVGGSIPIGLGIAEAFKRKGTGRKVVCFFGDAPWEQGTIWECLNIAYLRQLPILFVSEWNGLSTATPFWKRQTFLPSVMYEGIDAEAVYDIAKVLLDRLPNDAMFRVNRWCEHVGPAITNPKPDQCPVGILRDKLAFGEVDEIDRDIEAELEEAFREV